MTLQRKIKTILFVDDEKGMHELLRILFKKEIRNEEYQIYYFLSGRECIEFIEKFSNKESLLVLTDITMPEMDGFELLSYIKSHFESIPVVVISAYESSMYVEKAKTLGAIAYYTKPLDVDALKEFLKT